MQKKAVKKNRGARKTYTTYKTKSEMAYINLTI